jgi:hypothetical protein
MHDWTVYAQAGAAAFAFLGAALNLLTTLVRRGHRARRLASRPKRPASGRVGKNRGEPNNSRTGVMGDRQ